MAKSPKQLRDEAAQLRAHAEEITETNPTAAEYHERRAWWCEELARQREEDGFEDDSTDVE